MRSGLIAQKLGMTRVFTDAGEHIPVTVLKIDNCQVVAQRTSDKNGYTAIQLGVGRRKPSHVTKAERQNFAIAKVEPKRDTPPPPPNAPPPPPNTPPAPIRIGVSLSSTTEGGGFAVGTGSTLYGKTPDKAAAPSDATHEAKEAAQAPYVPYSQLSTLPKPIAVPRPVYPAKMKELQIEGKVILECRIDEQGKPSRIRVLQSLGKEFDDLAIESMRKARFEPGTMKGEAVVTDIRYSFTFELE